MVKPFNPETENGGYSDKEREEDFYTNLHRFRVGTYTTETLLNIFKKFENISQLEEMLFHNDLSTWERFGEDYRLITNETNTKGPLKVIHRRKNKMGRKTARQFFLRPDKTPAELPLEKRGAESAISYPELKKELSELYCQLKEFNGQKGYFHFGKPNLPRKSKDRWPSEKLREAIEILRTKHYLEQDGQHPDRLKFLK